DMEILSYVIEGALAHQDSIGNKAVIRPGELQRMSAGTGVRHSEQNELKDKPTHFLQIWIMPEANGLAPSYGQKNFVEDFTGGDLVLVASQGGKLGSVSLNQDVNLYAAKSEKAGEKKFQTSPQRYLWVQVIRGEVSANGEKLQAGDGAGLQRIEDLTLSWSAGSEFLFFDMVA
ncbi:MAG: pirin family protein, partial [Proteobacteria bacterium]